QELSLLVAKEKGEGGGRGGKQQLLLQSFWLNRAKEGCDPFLE
ncbi:hypothetical protein NPIL_354461, partial [Nephila pilipes]